MIYDVRIEQLALMALFDLKGSSTAVSDWCGAALPAFPERPLSYTTKGDAELMYLAPDHYLLRAPIAQEAALIEALKPDAAPDDISVVRVSDTLSFFSVSGTDAHEVMSIACPLDTHADVFPVTSATFSEVFSIKALILRTDHAFHLGVDRSYGPMIADYLARAIAD